MRKLSKINNNNDNNTHIPTITNATLKKFGSRPGKYYIRVEGKDTDGNLSEIEIKWGDGLRDIISIRGNSYAQNKIHSYVSNGTYFVNAIIRDNAGNSIHKEQSLVVNDF